MLQFMVSPPESHSCQRTWPYSRSDSISIHLRYILLDFIFQLLFLFVSDALLKIRCPRYPIGRAVHAIWCMIRTVLSCYPEFHVFCNVYYFVM